MAKLSKGLRNMLPLKMATAPMAVKFVMNKKREAMPISTNERIKYNFLFMI
jgi:hypothetical protein